MEFFTSGLKALWSQYSCFKTSSVSLSTWFNPNSRTAWTFLLFFSDVGVQICQHWREGRRSAASFNVVKSSRWSLRKREINILRLSQAILRLSFKLWIDWVSVHCCSTLNLQVTSWLIWSVMLFEPWSVGQNPLPERSILAQIMTKTWMPETLFRLRFSRSGTQIKHRVEFRVQ